MSPAFDVAVIGAGVFGAWTALQFRRTGRSVTLVDAFGTGNSRSSSSGASRLLRLGYGEQVLYSQWAQQSLAEWQQLFRRSNEHLFERTGVLWLSRPDDRTTSATIETFRLLHVPFEDLDRSELEHRYPQLSFGPVTRGLLEPEAGVIMARRAVQTVVGQAVKQSVDYRQVSVSPPVDTSHITSLFTSDGDHISAGVYIFCCGAWLPELFPTLLQHRIHPTRQEVLFFGPPPGDRRFTSSQMPAWIDFAGGVYGLPDLEGRGFKIGLDHHGPPFDPTSGARRVSDDAVKVGRMILAKRVPALERAPLLEAHVCQYSNSWNGDFLIDQHPEIDNLWIVGGGSGHGFKHGPAVGLYVTKQIAEGAAPQKRFTLSAHGPERQRMIY